MHTLVPSTPHMKGDDVHLLQTLLADHHWYHGAIDGEYGPLTWQAVYRAKYWLGYPKPDHVAGSVLLSFLSGSRKQTRSMLRLVSKRLHKKPVGLTNGQKLLKIEAEQIGYKEDPPGSNHTKFGVWYGFNGVPWCAIFQSWSAAQAGLTFRYAYVPYVVADARAGKNGLTLVHPAQVQAGDLVCYDWDRNGVADHIGCFEKWNDSTHNSFTAIEGNTSEGNDSNGGEVMRRSDRITPEVQAFVRIGR